MKVKDLIEPTEKAIAKFEGKEDFEDRVLDMKESLKRMKLLPPKGLEVELSKKDEKYARKSFKSLGIEIATSPIDDKAGLMKELNRIMAEELAK